MAAAAGPGLSDAVLAEAAQLRQVLAEHQIRLGSHAAANDLAGLRAAAT